MSGYVGWDLGGAHLKAVLVDAGRVRSVWQVACPLWRGLAHLDRAVTAVLEHLPARCVHGVIMTGEMVDLFDDRGTGVRALLDVFARRAGAAEVVVLCEGKFIPLSKYPNQPIQTIASNNWQASARYLAEREPEALLVDVGSTTCDLVPVRQGRMMVRGFDDHGRLRHGELVYMGVVRTPLMAVTRQVPFQGGWVPLMAEHFATIGDVYRILGRLPDHADQADTADGRPRTAAASMRRLARMLGLDREAAPDQAWEGLAGYFQELQIQSLTRACLYQLAHGFRIRPRVVGAGVGRFLVEEVARRLGLDYRDLGTYFSEDSPPGSGFSAADCAPAAALACLLEADRRQWL